MHPTSDNKFKKLVVIGDRVLIRPSKPHERTESGLYLPSGLRHPNAHGRGDMSAIFPYLCRLVNY